MKKPEDYSVDDVCVLFVSLELGHVTSKVRENVVDGPLLLSLTEADFVNDLGLTGLQSKRVLLGIELAKQISASPSGGGGSDDELAEAHHTIHRLEKEIKELKDELSASPSVGGGVDELAEAHHTIYHLEKEIKELKEEVMDLRAALQPEPPAQPTPSEQQQQKQYYEQKDQQQHQHK